ncbi:SAV_6107 family HEPN domain-containing protein, partial [Streptomyces bambusae]
RTAAAVLAARGRPEPVSPRRRPRIRSAWEVLPEIAPELVEWSALFASGAARRARAEAGIPDAASSRDADDLLRAASMFLRLVERMLALQPVLPQPRPTGLPERPDAG